MLSTEDSNRGVFIINKCCLLKIAIGLVFIINKCCLLKIAIGLVHIINKCTSHIAIFSRQHLLVINSNPIAIFSRQHLLMISTGPIAIFMQLITIFSRQHFSMATHLIWPAINICTLWFLQKTWFSRVDLSILILKKQTNKQKTYGQCGMLVLWTSMNVDDNNTLKACVIYRRHNFF